MVRRFTKPLLFPAILRCEPAGQIGNIDLHIIEFLSFPADFIPRTFPEKTWTAHGSVPVVIDEMVKAGFGDCPAQRVAMEVDRSLKRDNQIKLAIRHSAASNSDHVGIMFTLRDTDSTFMWMRRKLLDES